MNGQKTIILAMVLLCLIGTKALTGVEFKDGLIHDIDYEIDDYVVEVTISVLNVVPKNEKK